MYDLDEWNVPLFDYSEGCDRFVMAHSEEQVIEEMAKCVGRLISYKELIDITIAYRPLGATTDVTDATRIVFELANDPTRVAKFAADVSQVPFNAFLVSPDFDVIEIDCDHYISSWLKSYTAMVA